MKEAAELTSAPTSTCRLSSFLLLFFFLLKGRRPSAAVRPLGRQKSAKEPQVSLKGRPLGKRLVVSGELVAHLSAHHSIGALLKLHRS